MKILLITIVFLLTSMAQAVFADSVAVFGARPDFVLIAVVFFCLRAGWQKGMMLGVIAGFILDIFSVGRVGLFSATYGLCGFFLGLFTRNVYFENPLTQSLIVFFFTYVAAGVFFLLSSLFYEVPASGIFVQKVIPQSIYDLFFSFGVFVVLRRFEGKRLIRV